MLHTERPKPCARFVCRDEYFALNRDPRISPRTFFMCHFEQVICVGIFLVTSTTVNQNVIYCRCHLRAWRPIQSQRTSPRNNMACGGVLPDGSSLRRVGFLSFFDFVPSFVFVCKSGMQSSLVSECRSGGPSALCAAVPCHLDVFDLGSGSRIVMIRGECSVFGWHVRVVCVF